ncbi:hypothetical protein CCACVL1_27464 [Corchorus capsularis]|uniref:Uncharacterized protein n=1 Tax=Corchorus capsularis TaxID=210143 RepID=A0A1R3GA51_COCAP|nr:hypothetical protein CCACVL1_27464 [Corchorus capsularis]
MVTSRFRNAKITPSLPSILSGELETSFSINEFRSAYGC